MRLSPPAGAERRRVDLALILLSAAFVFDTVLYSAVTPLIPHYADELDLGKTSVGILAATYPVGIVAGSLLAIRLTGSIGVRAITLGGLALLAASTLAFGLVEGIVLLDLTRLAQGLASGCIWSGALAWLFLRSGDRHGAALGSAMGAGVFGTVVGPALGSAAVALGTHVLYPLVALMIVVLAVALARIAAPAEKFHEESPVAQVLRGPGVRSGLWIVVFPGAILGAVNALVPLRLSDLGASELFIGATFMTAALVGVFAAPLSGRLSDRKGPTPLIAVGLVILAASCVALGLAPTTVLLGLAAISFFGIALSVAWVPAMALLAKRAALAGAAPVLAAALVNISLSVGEAIGSPASAVAAEATSTDAVVFVGLGVACLITSASVWLGRPDARAQSASLIK